MPLPPPSRVVSWLLLGASAALLPAQQKQGRQTPAPDAAAPLPVLAIGTASAPRAKVPADTAAAIDRALQWLRERQQPNGRWDCDGLQEGAGSAVHDVAVTGLALLVLAREGPPSRQDARRDALLRGSHWLALQQQDNGLLGVAASHDFIYDHATATLGLAAAAAATGSAEARDAVVEAVAYLESHRNPYMVWRYQPRDGDNDTSVTAWATLACLAARELGVTVEPRTFASVRGYLANVTDEHGRTGYTRAGEPSSRSMRNAKRFPPDHGEAMTAAALWCRQALGEAPDAHAVLPLGVELLLAKPPVWEPDAGKVDLCYWFFGSEALRRTGRDGHDAWTDALQHALRRGQRDDGSWDAVDPWGSDGGRLYATSLAVLALQALYDVPALRGDGAPAVK